MIGALLGAAVSFIVQTLKIEIDECWARAEEVCKAVAELADLATEYWLIDLAKGSDEETKKARVNEARIIGFQTKIDGLFDQLSECFRSQDQSAARDSIVTLFDSCSGGEFGSRSRPLDGNRARDAQTTAASAVVQIRKAVRQGTTPERVFLRRWYWAIILLIFAVAFFVLLASL